MAKSQQQSQPQPVQQSEALAPAPSPSVPSLRRYSTAEAFAAPTDVETAWVERRTMIKAILNAGVLTMRDRATKYVLAIEKEAFMKNAQERKPQPPLTIESLLDVFNS